MDNNLDQEPEKYIFDPANPSGFKAYNLLLNILRERNNVAYISPTFMLEIFYEEIFDEDFKKMLTGELDNSLDSMNSTEQIAYYIDIFSQENIYGDADLKLSNQLKSRVTDLFNAQLYSDYAESFVLIQYHKLGIRLNNVFLNELLEFDEENSSISSEILDVHKIFFLGKNETDILKHIKSNSSDILITTLDNFENTKAVTDFPNGTFSPVFFKKIEDVRPFLSYLIQGVNTPQKTMQTPNKPTNSFLASIDVENFFTIKKIHLDGLEQYKEIFFLSEPGHGKTLMLQSIVLALKGNQSVGRVVELLNENIGKSSLSLGAMDSEGYQYGYEDGASHSFGNLAAYGINRLGINANSKDEIGYLSLFAPDTNLQNPVEWLNAQFRQSLKIGTYSALLENLLTFFHKIFEEELRIEVNADGVTFYDVNSNRLNFSQLSNSFKSILILICDMTARFSATQPQVQSIYELTGVVLIDELELWLHPKWQKIIIPLLCLNFPKIQFIVSTNSPIILMGSSREAVFYKVYKEKGETKMSTPYYSANLSNLMANSVLTSSLFDMDNVRMYGFVPEEEDLETNPDYLSIKIHNQIKEKIARDKEAGKFHFSEQEINIMIENALK